MDKETKDLLFFALIVAVAGACAAMLAVRL